MDECRRLDAKPFAKPLSEGDALAELDIWDVEIPLPKVIRDHGTIPDLRLLLPGDVFLLADSHSKPDVIRLGQRMLGYPSEHAQWQHAAIYLGGGLAVVESVPVKGVCVGSLYQELLGRTFRVRRTSVNPSGTEIAHRALAYLDAGYGWAALLRAWTSDRRKIPGWTDHGPEAKAVFCSELCPAFLSRTELLVDVDVPWRRIA